MFFSSSASTMILQLLTLKIPLSQAPLVPQSDLMHSGLPFQKPKSSFTVVGSPDSIHPDACSSRPPAQTKVLHHLIECGSFGAQWH